MDKNNPVDYTIISAPVTVNFMCPHCFNDVEVPFSDVDFKTDYWCDERIVIALYVIRKLN